MSLFTYILVYIFPKPPHRGHSIHHGKILCSVGLEHLCQAPHYPSLTQGEGDLVTHAQQLPKAHLLVRGMDPQLHHSAKQASA